MQPLPGGKSGTDAWGSEERIPEVTMVGTELVMELGGASMPDGCSGGSGGGGPVSHRGKEMAKSNDSIYLTILIQTKKKILIFFHSFSKRIALLLK